MSRGTREIAVIARSVDDLAGRAVTTARIVAHGTPDPWTNNQAPSRRSLR